MVWVELANKKLKNLFFFFTMFLYTCSPPTLNRDFYENTLGVNIVPQKRIYFFSEESTRSEGFIFEIVKYEQKESLRIDDNRPLPYKEVSKWSIKKWNNQAVKDLRDFDPIFTYDIRDEQLLCYLKRVKELLIRGGDYYCYYYLDPDGTGNIGVDLYLIDSKEKQIYCIYSRV